MADRGTEEVRTVERRDRLGKFWTGRGIDGGGGGRCFIHFDCGGVQKIIMLLVFLRVLFLIFPISLLSPSFSLSFARV